MNYTHRHVFGQPRALPAGYTRYKLIGACLSCNRVDVPQGSKPLRLPHWPAGLAAWECFPCWQTASAALADVLGKLIIPQGRDTGCTVGARFPEGVR